MTFVLTRRGDEDIDTYNGKVTQIYREIDKLRWEASEKINPAETLIMDFQPP